MKGHEMHSVRADTGLANPRRAAGRRWPALVAGIVATGGLAGALAFAAPSGGGTKGPFDLISLASMGTVTWTCGVDQAAYSLGFRPERNAATMRIVLRLDGAPSARFTLTSRDMPVKVSRARRQELRIAQRTGAGTLHARLSVDFGAQASARPCYPYLPPKTSVSMGPRR